MGVEIERKFLVRTKKLPRLPKGSVYDQGYLSLKPAVRIRASEDGGWITVKGPGKVSKSEFEYSISRRDAEDMMALCKWRLRKIRYKVRVGSHVWDVDEFQSGHRGLWVAEVELRSEDEEFVLPEWAGKEVTGDSRYSNANLAKAGRAPARRVRA